MLNNRICYLLSLKCVSKFKLFGSCVVNIYLKCFGYECVGLMSDITVLCKKKMCKKIYNKWWWIKNIYNNSYDQQSNMKQDQHLCNYCNIYLRIIK